MKTYAFYLLFAACGAVYCPSQLDAFRDLARRYYELQSPAAPAHTPTPSTPQQNQNNTSEVHGPGKEPEAENAPKLVQFAQRETNKMREFKQVEGANDGGEASTPDKNLAAWFSTPLFDAPTRASWLDDDNYDPDALAAGWAKLRNQATSQGPRVKTKEKTAGGKVLNAMGSGGAAMGGLGGPASATQQENDMRQSLMQKGRAERAVADSSDAAVLHAAARARALRARQARQSWSAVVTNTRTTRARGAFASMRAARSRHTSATQTSPRAPQISPRMRSRLLQFRSSISLPPGNAS